MTTASLTHADLALRDGVLQQLAWDSQVDASGIGVAAHDGAVTLTGFIDSYAGKLAAERAAKRVRGVRAVANDIQVTLRIERSDAEIAGDIARALELRAALPDTVQAAVHNGHVTLTGSVRTLFHRSVAEKALRYVRGVKGVINRISVTPTAVTHDVQRHIVSALHREADIKARGISVVVDNGTVILSGQVRTWHERESAERAATHAPGIRHVDNRLTVAWPDRADMEAEPEIC
jgi:osmotically-inducible protein OsmY